MNSKTLKTTTIVLALLLIGAVIYIFTLKKELENQTNSVVNIEMEKLDLQAEIDSLDLEISNYKELDLKQDSTLQATYIDLDARKNEIQNLINKGNLSASEITNLRGQVNSLKSQLTHFKSELNRLKEENEGLRLAMDTLNTENVKMKDSIGTISTQYQDVQSKYNNTKDIVHNTLSLSDFNITPLKVRKSGKEVEKDVHTKVNKLKVNFKLDPNPEAQSGTKTLYICIRKPNGDLANFENGTTGSFVDKDGKTVNYSDKVNVNYSNTSGSPVEFDWDYEDFSKGTYKIDVYQNGFKIGQESRSLK